MVKDLTCAEQGRGFKSFRVIMWVLSWQSLLSLTHIYSAAQNHTAILYKTLGLFLETLDALMFISLNAQETSNICWRDIFNLSFEENERRMVSLK